jgi:hypothetical protein
MIAVVDCVAAPLTVSEFTPVPTGHRIIAGP